MQTAPTIKFTEHMGRRLGRAWGVVAYRETRVTQWLAAFGIPVAVAKLIPLIVKLILLVVLLSIVFWVALLLVLVVAAAWALKNSTWTEENKLEWREGHSGFGLYDKKEWRHDLGDPDKPQ